MSGILASSTIGPAQVTYVGSGLCTTAAATHTYSITHGSTSWDRQYACFVVARDSSNTAYLTALTLAGVTAQAVVKTNSTGTSMELGVFYVTVPAGTNITEAVATFDEIVTGSALVVFQIPIAGAAIRTRGSAIEYSAVQVPTDVSVAHNGGFAGMPRGIVFGAIGSSMGASYPFAIQASTYPVTIHYEANVTTAAPIRFVAFSCPIIGETAPTIRWEWTGSSYIGGGMTNMGLL